MYTAELVYVWYFSPNQDGSFYAVQGTPAVA